MARLRSTSGVSVLTVMPFSQARTQAAAKTGVPVSTTHIRHTPTGSKRSSWHSTGRSMPAALAACQIVEPSGAVTSRPSIVSVTVPVDSGAVIAIVRIIRLHLRLCQAEALRSSRSWAAHSIQAAFLVVAIDHGPQPGRREPRLASRGERQRLLEQPGGQPVVLGPPALAQVVEALGEHDPAGG